MIYGRSVLLDTGIRTTETEVSQMEEMNQVSQSYKPTSSSILSDICE